MTISNRGRQKLNHGGSIKSASLWLCPPYAPPKSAQRWSQKDLPGEENPPRPLVDQARGGPSSPASCMANPDAPGSDKRRA